VRVQRRAALGHVTTGENRIDLLLEFVEHKELSF
jgi:hypothetical protein